MISPRGRERDQYIAVIAERRIVDIDIFDKAAAALSVAGLVGFPTK